MVRRRAGVTTAKAGRRAAGLRRRAGYLTLREEGVLMAREGKTTLEEVLNVTHGESDRQPEDDAESDGV